MRLVKYEKYLMKSLTHFLSKCVVPIVLIFLILAGVSLIYTFKNLTFSTQRNELISEEAQYNQRYLSYEEEFTGHDNVVILIRVDKKKKWKEFSQKLAKKLQGNKELIRYVFYKLDFFDLEKNGIYFFSADQLQNLQNAFIPIADLLVELK